MHVLCGKPKSFSFQFEKDSNDKKKGIKITLFVIMLKFVYELCSKFMKQLNYFEQS